MNSAVNILNMQKTPVQTQIKTANQTADTVFSFLSLLQNAANSGRTESTYKSNSVQSNNLNKNPKMENPGNEEKNIVLNNGAKINDRNNAKINLESNSDKSDGLATVLEKVLNGEQADLSKFDEADIAEAVKKVTAEITVKDEDHEKIDICKVLEMLGVPAQIIPEMIAAVIEPEMIVESVNSVNSINSINSVENVNIIETLVYAGSGQIQEAGEITAVKSSFNLTAETKNEPVLMSVSEAEDFIAETAEYIYAERTAEMLESSGAVTERVLENIADFADIIEETGDFKYAVADYAVEKIQANNSAEVKMNAENIKEVIIQVLNQEQPEIEVLSAVKTNESAAEKPAPTVFDILNSMRKAGNILHSQSAENNNTKMIGTIEPEMSEMLKSGENDGMGGMGGMGGITETSEITEGVQEIAESIEIAANADTPEIFADEILPDAETAMPTNTAEALEVSHLAGIINAGVSAQNLESEVNIETFAADISRVITEKTQSIFNRKLQGTDEIIELRLRLKPAELGEVFMKITYKNGNVGVNIVAAHAMAERAILSQMGDLRASLNAQEINLAEFDVNNFNNYNQNAQNQNSRQSNDKNDSNGSQNNRSTGERIGLNNSINEVQIRQDYERREAVANYIKSRRIFYKTI